MTFFYLNGTKAADLGRDSSGDQSITSTFSGNVTARLRLTVGRVSSNRSAAALAPTAQQVLASFSANAEELGLN